MDPKVTEIPLTTPMGRLDGHTLLELDDRLVVLQRWQSGHVSWYGTGVHERVDVKDASPERTLGDLAVLALQQPVRRAFRLPKGRIVSVPGWFGNRRWVRPLAILLAVTAAVVVLFLLVLPDVVKIFGVLGIVGLPLLSLILLTGLGVELFDVHRMMYKTSWRRWEFADLAALADRDDLADRQITAVKEEYGRLRSDLTYRIEHPALFDATCPTTETFHLALVEWDAAGEQLSRVARGELASRVVATFRHARHHAEQVGMEHLPRAARRPARRAVKALRVATDPHASATERATALERAVALLDGLVLHHLPTGPEIHRAVGAQHRRQLPGRGSS